MAKLRMQVLILLLLACSSWICSAQEQQQQEQQQQFPNSTCQGVFLSYKVKPATRIPPFISDAKQQPYKFEADLTLTNMGFSEVKNWQAFVGFQHREWLVSASKSVLSDGGVLPAPLNGTTLSGFPETKLQNAIETAGDLSKTSVTINLVGTEFGVAELPLPFNISFPVPGYSCGEVTNPSNDTLQLCCSENQTAVDLSKTPDRFLPMEKGDISITYSVVQAFKGNYWAEVQISNDAQFGRLDGWNLTWEWKQGEFIYAMKGAHALEQDQTDCLNGPAGEFYKDTDFSVVMSCKKIPTIADLPPSKFFDTAVGNIPSCCRDGLLLPKIMDPSKSKSVFQLQVFKIPPNDARDALEPPVNFNIGQRYTCQQPRLVAPFEKTDPGSPNRSLSAIKTWQVVCNVTDGGRGELQQIVSDAGGGGTGTGGGGCCVSFSGFYNSSAMACPTCACGCPKDPNPTCDAESQPLLIPTYALLTPFDNRTGVTNEWARLNRAALPRVRPCGDNCGVNINWHVASDSEGTWTARFTILNWGGNVSDWFAAVELEKAISGLKEVYSLNGSAAGDGLGGGKNKTLYLQGKDGFNDFLLNAEIVKDKLNPGKLQAVIIFDKKKSRGVNVTGGDGFPTKVIFNGQQCVLPSGIPTSFGIRRLALPRIGVLLAAAAAALWVMS